MLNTKRPVGWKRNVVVYIFLGVFFTGLLLMFWRFPQGQSVPQVQRSFREEFDLSKKALQPGGPVASPLKEADSGTTHTLMNKKVESTPVETSRADTAKAAPVHVVPASAPAVPVASAVREHANSADHAASSGALGSDTMLLIICANRPEYLQKTFEAVMKYRPVDLPMFVSQDGSDGQVEKLIKGTFLHLQLSSPDVQFIHKQHHGEGHYENGYFRLADHYKWALNEVFRLPNVKRVIILEEDLVIAPDFFELFAATAGLLDTDTNLLAVSAWNDNGMSQSVRDPAQLYRSDFFPGLGWMMPRRIWEELGPRWPKAYWDDWLREPKQRKGRHIIRPEVCRTFHIGQRGVSNAQYSSYLTSIRLNENAVSFSSMDLSYLQQEKWDDIYLNQVRAATLISVDDARSGRGLLTAKRQGTKEVRVVYDRFEGTENSYSVLAAWSGAMDNVKAGVPRTAYKGIVTVWMGEVKVHLVPASFQ